MSASVFETFYEKDWGYRARAVRNNRRTGIVKAQNHAAGVVRGKVHHPIFGTGFDLHYRRNSGGGDYDVRVTPQGAFSQLPPTPTETEERWEETPTW